MKRLLLILLLLATLTLPGYAVLKEQNLNRTLHVLRLELREKYHQQEESMKRIHARNQAQHTNLVNIMKRCETTSLILYSQGQDFTFDVAYACQEATSLYHELRSKTMPFDDIKNNISTEIGRYDSLIVSLQRLPPAIDTARTEDLHQLEMAIRNVRAGEVDNMDMPTMEGVPMDGIEMEAISTDDVNHNETFMLDSLGRQDRDSCIYYAANMRDNLSSILEGVELDNAHYTSVYTQVEKLNNYAQQKYADLQQSIFVNPGTDYLTILSGLPKQWSRMQGDFRSKYKTLADDQTPDGKVRPYPSEWRGPIVMFASIFMLVYILVAALLSNVIVRWLLPKAWRERYKEKRTVLIIILALIIFLVAVMVARTVMKQNLMLMASSLMLEMAWMVLAIYVSMAVRLKDDQSLEGSKIYSPFILMSLIVICFRIILIPNTMVNVIFPPILILFTIWQAFTLRKCRNNVPFSDKIYCSISLFVMLISCIMACVGYSLMAVQLLVLWMFQLAAIATITCCYDLMESYESHYLLPRVERKLFLRSMREKYGDNYNDDELLGLYRKETGETLDAAYIHNYLCEQHGQSFSKERLLTLIKRGDFVGSSWFYDLINRCVVPVCAVFSLLFSVSMAADIFNLRDLCMRYFFAEHSIPSVATFSVYKLCLAVALFFVFRYVNYLIRAAWFGYRRSRGTSRSSDATLSKNIIGLATWGIYIVTVFLMLKVPSDGIAIVSGGLATGMGFASKSLLENFFYGISLMSGRVRVGDYIECDGITGKVESITYQSTQLLTLDGSIVAILNSDLFSKNFKNLTRNHQYELTKVPFGVAYGCNVDEVRQMILEGLKPLCTKTADDRDMVDPAKPLSVVFSDFGASSVDLCLVGWVLVDQRIGFVARAKEVIYEVLNAHGIEIPFPQQDVYIRSVNVPEAQKES